MPNSEIEGGSYAPLANKVTAPGDRAQRPVNQARITQALASRGIDPGSASHGDPALQAYIDAYNQKKARIDYYNRLKAAQANGQRLSPEDAEWLGQVDAAPMARTPGVTPTTSPLQHGMIQQHQELMKRKMADLGFMGPAGPMNDGPGRQVSAEEARQYGLRVETPPTDWGIREGQTPPDGFVVPPGMGTPQPRVLEGFDPARDVMDERGQQVPQLGQLLGVEDKLAPRQTGEQQFWAKKFPNAGMVYNHQDADLRQIARSFPDQNPTAERAYQQWLEQNYGKTLDMVDSNGGYPEGYFDRLQHDPAVSKKQAVDEYMKYVEELKRRRDYQKQTGGKFGFTPGPSV